MCVCMCVCVCVQCGIKLVIDTETMICLLNIISAVIIIFSMTCYAFDGSICLCLCCIYG